MRSTSEAPVAEPHRFKGPPAGGRRRRPATRAGGRVRRSPTLRRARVIEGLDARCEPGEVLGIVGPSGCGKSTLLELVGGLREPSAGTIEVGGAGARRRTARPLRLHAPARPAAALAVGDRQRRARAAQPRRLAGRGAPGGAPPVRALRAGRVRARRARPSSPAGCGSGSPSCGPCSPASRCCCSTSPSPRSTRSPAPRCRSGWPRRSPPSRAPRSWSPTTSRRPSTCPTGWRSSRARPARVVAELRAPSPRALPRRGGHRPEFTAARASGRWRRCSEGRR